MPILVITIILACICSVFVGFLATPRGRGWFGEFRVKLVIGKSKNGVKYVINDLKIRISDGKTSQIDHIVVNKRGVFVIETKNYSGRIYGQEKQLEWTQVLNYGRVKNKLYNPVKQNATHVYHISNIIGDKIPIYSVVVFVQGNTQYINSKGVYTLRELKAALRKGKTELNYVQMQNIYDNLLQMNDKSISRTEHIKNIHALQKGVNNNICPRCGKALVLRNGSKGSFMGCEGYPRCKFTKRV